MIFTQSARGFTRIGLLMVVAIITILAAVLFPVFAQARAKDGSVRPVEAQEVNRCNNYWDGDGAGRPCRAGERNPRYSTARD